MPDYDERAETLHRAALLVIRAKQEAATLLRPALVECNHPALEHVSE